MRAEPRNRRLRGKDRLRRRSKGRNGAKKSPRAPNEGNKEGQVYGKVVEMCMQCHDLDNSPDFDFQKYWPKVKHVGKD